MTQNPGDGALRVLVVEDNPGDVRLIREAFERSDVDSSLTTVTNGEDALDYLYRRRGCESETRPDLVVLDLNIPKVTGRSVLEKTKAGEDRLSIPVIVFSGSGAPDEIRATYELGADAYYVKPADPEEFISIIRSVGEAVARAERLPPGEDSDVHGTE